jgi:hypothetical protein
MTFMRQWIAGLAAPRGVAPVKRIEPTSQ